MTVVSPKASVYRPGFHDFNGRRLFGLEVVPTGPCRGAVLYLPPFAEEMNRLRSHVATQARALAAAGWHCLLLDPYGTGESDGRIIDADWDTWRADAGEAGRWLAQTTGQSLTLWGVRTGALLAAEVAASSPPLAARLLFWQPVLDGKLFLNQYLRLRIASQMVNDTERETTDTIRARLAAGEVLEVAGYPLTAAVADGMASRKLSDALTRSTLPIAWAEVVAKPDQPLSVPSRKLVDSLQAAGRHVDVEAVACPMVWQVHERVDAVELIQATSRLLGALR